MTEYVGVTLKTLHAGKSLYNAKKYTEARQKIDQVVSFLDRDESHQNWNEDNLDSLPSRIDLHALLADCLLKEADQIRKRGLNQPITKIPSDDEDDESDEDSDDDGSAVVRKRRRPAPLPPRVFTSAESIDADVVRYKELLQESLKEVEAGLSSESQSSSSSPSSSSSIRCLLIIGSEILLKLSSLGPSISSADDAANLRHQASCMVDKLERLNVNSLSLPVRNEIFPSSSESFDRREWKILQLLHHRKYSDVVETHPAAPLMRNKRKTLFLAMPNSDEVDDSRDVRPFETNLDNPCYAFPNVEDALDFALPDVFDEALNPQLLDQTSTFILLPTNNEVKNVKDEKDGRCLERGTEVITACSKVKDEGKSNEEEAEEEGEEEELIALEEGLAKLCTKYNITDLPKDDSKEETASRSDDHVCFYNQRFYRLHRLADRKFCIQLLFCDLCVVEDNIDAVFFLHGLVPKQLDETTDLSVEESAVEREEEEEWSRDKAILDYYGDDDDDFGLSRLDLNDDKAVFRTLFPAIKSVF